MKDQTLGPGMSPTLMEKFQLGEDGGDTVHWRIVRCRRTAGRPGPYLVYRVIQRHGQDMTEYLRYDGVIDWTCIHGMYDTLTDIGLAFAEYDKAPDRFYKDYQKFLDEEAKQAGFEARVSTWRASKP